MQHSIHTDELLNAYHSNCGSYFAWDENGMKVNLELVSKCQNTIMCDRRACK